MAASVRVAQVTASGAAPVSVGKGVSRGGSAVTVRIAGITASSVSTAPYVRISDITAVSGVSQAFVRVADVRAFSPETTYTWDGTRWVAAAPAGVALSAGKGVSSGSGTVSIPGQSAQSAGKGRSDASGSTVAFTGTLDLSGGGTFAASGAETGPEDHVGTLALSGTGTLKLTGSALQGPPGAGSLTVVPQPDNAPPRILLELTGALGTQVTITRVDAAGNRSPVRDGNPAQLTAGSCVLYDYEPQYGETVRYVATTSGPTITSDPVTLPVERPWMVHPGIPDLSQPITVAAMGDRTYGTNQGVHRPIGRRNALVISDGQRQSAAYELTLRTDTAQNADALDQLLWDASPLLLQVLYPGAARRVYEWVSVGQVVRSDVVPTLQSEPQQWVLECTVVDPPVGLLQAQRTAGDVAAEFATAGGVAAAYATARDVILDNRIS